MQPISTKYLSLWMGSFVIVGSFLYFHFEVPLLPIGLAGIVTFGIALGRRFLSKRAPKPGS